jgi:hypothetical protein
MMSVSGRVDPTKMFLKSSFNMTTHEHTSFKNTGRITSLFPTHHTAKILLPPIYNIPFEVLKDIRKQKCGSDDVEEVAASTKLKLI